LRSSSGVKDYFVSWDIPVCFERMYPIFKKKFSMVSDRITQDLLSFIDNQHDREPFRELFGGFISSDKGRELMKNRIKEVLPERVSHRKMLRTIVRRGIQRSHTSTSSFS
jgi:hypothetical protein